MKLGILDFGEIGVDMNATTRIHQTIELAQFAEKAGVHRYWLSEHQNGSCAWRSPELVINLIAGYTDRIKVGAAGVLLCLYAPIKVAQDYKLLENLYPGRIDLGFARGMMDTERFREMADGANVGEKQGRHYERIKKILGFLNDEDIETHTAPLKGSVPDVWVLSGSLSAAGFVTEHRLNLSLSLFHNTSGVTLKPDMVRQFRESYYKAHGRLPVLNMAVSAYCTNSREKESMMIHKSKSLYVNITGNKDELAEKLAKIGSDYEADELVIMNLGSDMNEKMYLLEALDESGLCSSELKTLEKKHDEQ